MKLGKWKVTLPDEEYEFSPDDLPLSDWLMIGAELRASGEWVSPRKFLYDVDDKQMGPCQVLVWFLRRKDGRNEDRFTVDFPLLSLEMTPVDDEGEEDDPEAPAGSGPATSQPSPPTTESSRGSGDGSPSMTLIA